MSLLKFVSLVLLRRHLVIRNKYIIEMPADIAGILSEFFLL